MSSQPLQELEVLKDLYDAEGVDINLKRLATLLGISSKALAEGLGLHESAFSRKPYAPQNPALNEWLGIFNLIIKVIHEAKPEIAAEEIKLNMQRWLRLARPEFNNKTPIEYMLAGKSRHVKNLLEQLLD